MNFLEHYYNKKLKYDLINKFFYLNLKKLPKLKKIVLNFRSKTPELKTLAASMLALELIGKTKGILTTTSKTNLYIKIRKGSPVGCKLTLKKTLMLKFLEKNLNEIFTKIKKLNELILTEKVKTNNFSYQIKNIFHFYNLEEHYYLFNNVPRLNITFITNTKTKKEMLFILKALKIPLK